MTDTIVGASTCASGSHIWKGNIGIFIAKGIKKNNQRNFCSCGEKITFNKTSYSKDSTKVYTYKIPNSKKKEPNNVYRKK